VPEATTIAPLAHCIPAGTGPISWTVPDPQRDQVLVEGQVISPSVQVPPVEEGVAGAALATEEAAAVGAAAAEVSAGDDATGATPSLAPVGAAGAFERVSLGDGAAADVATGLAADVATGLAADEAYDPDEPEDDPEEPEEEPELPLPVPGSESSQSRV